MDEQKEAPITQETSLNQIPSTSENSLTHNSKRQALLIAGIGLLLLFLIGGFLFLNQQGLRNKQSDIQNLVQPTSIQSSPTPDATGNWKTYTNTQYSFSFKYPQSLDICQTCGVAGPVSSGLQQVGFKDPKDHQEGFDGFSVYVIPNDQKLTFSSFIEQEQKKNVTNFGESLPEQKIMIDNEVGVLLKGVTFGIVSYSIPFPDNSHFLVISVSGTPTFKKSMEQILLTFRFTDRAQGNEHLQMEPAITKKEYLLSNNKKVEVQTQGFKSDIYLIDENALSKKIYTFETPFSGGAIDFEENEGYFALTHIGSLEAEVVDLFNPEGTYIPLGESEEDRQNYKTDKERAIGSRGGLGDTLIRFTTYKGVKTLEVIFRVNEDWVSNYDLTGRYIEGSFRVIN